MKLEIELPERARETLEAVAAFRGLSVPEAALAVFLEGLEMADTIREHDQAQPHDSIDDLDDGIPF